MDCNFIHMDELLTAFYLIQVILTHHYTVLTSIWADEDTEK